MKLYFDTALRVRSSAAIPFALRNCCAEGTPLSAPKKIELAEFSRTLKERQVYASGIWVVLSGFSIAQKWQIWGTVSEIIWKPHWNERGRLRNAVVSLKMGKLESPFIALPFLEILSHNFWASVPKMMCQMWSILYMYQFMESDYGPLLLAGWKISFITGLKCGHWKLKVFMAWR